MYNSGNQYNAIFTGTLVTTVTNEIVSKAVGPETKAP